MLEEENYEIVVAQDGEMGLHIARETRPHLILSDVRMPKMSGVELLEHVRTDENLQHIPFIFMSAFSTSSEYAKQHKVKTTFHPDAYIQKPFTEDALISIIATVLNQT